MAGNAGLDWGVRFFDQDGPKGLTVYANVLAHASQLALESMEIR